MFDKEKFSSILIEINKNYNNMSEFAKVANFDRTYISKYIHKKLDNPPTPKILMGIANASKGQYNYYTLMEICGYIKDLGTVEISNSLKNPSPITALYIFENINNELTYIGDLWINNYFIIPGNNYFAYKCQDESMSPLLGINDIAIIKKTDKFSNNDTCLISLDNNTIFIRKILDLKTHIELQPINYNFDTIKLTKDDMEKRNFQILGKVVKVENLSAFK